MAEGSTITFELIRKIQREEQRMPKLTKLPEGFFKSVKAYIGNKRETSSRKTALEMKNIERLVEDIFNRRERKILNLAIIAARTNIPPENLSEEETDFFNQIMMAVKVRREDILDMLLMEEKPEKADLVIFKEDVSAFVGADMKNYGPFTKGDIAKLPDENREVLMSRGVVQEFKLNK